MPDFARAAVSTVSQDLGPYLTFLKKLQIGQVVILPLEPGESTRAVNMRLARLPGGKEAVRFRLLSPEKRVVRISDEAKQSRVAKAKATRDRPRGSLAS